MKTYSVERTIEVDATIEVEMEAGEKGTPRTMDGPGTPDYEPAACVVALRIGGVSVPLSVLSRAEQERIEDAALCDAIEEAADAYEAAMEDRADAARERRLLGD